MKKIMIFLALCGTVGLFAVGCSRSPEAIADKIAGRIASKLDLNDVQKQKLEKIKVAMLAEYKEKKANRGANKEAIKKIILAEKLDKVEIKSMMESKKEKFEAKFEKYFPMVEDFHASLNAGQKQKLVELSEKMHKRHSHWR